MKRLLPLVAAVGLFACATPLNPSILKDGNLAIAALNALDTDAVALGAPAADTAAIDLAIAALQTGLTDLGKGSETAADFATLADDEISLLAPVLLRDFHANQTITVGALLLQNMIPIIAADAAVATGPSPAPAARSLAVSVKAEDVRAQLMGWIASHKR